LANVSRMEIAGSIRGAFAQGPVSREELLETADRASASPEVKDALAGLPRGKRFGALRDLWPHLHEVPVQREADPATRSR
jgi:hypothetical protein